jgi:hypothetical protein
MTTFAFDTTSIESPLEPAQRWWQRRDVQWSLGGFFLFGLLILLRSPAMLEPDDFAYRASIAALTHGQILLTNAQYTALSRSLGGQGIMQWHHMSSGLWISEKNPGYPFVAVLFYAIGLLRLAPLFFGAVACVGLFIGATRWLGRPAGAVAVWLYLASGAALTFAWRATMPSFTDASLLAAGAGLLLWTLLAVAANARRRRAVGLLALLLIELAVFIRYTNVIELFVAVLVVVLTGRRSRISWATIAVWLMAIGIAGVGMLAFNAWAYGSATSTGYSAGEITFSWSALWPNLRGMPWQLTQAMPLWLLAAISVVWVVVRALRAKRSGQSSRRTDLFVVAGLSLGWLGLWALYLCYTWTANMVGGGHGGGPGGGGVTVHVIRFYLPALGLLALVACWFVMRLPRRLGAGLLALLSLCAVLSFNTMASSGSVGGNGGFGGNPGGFNSGQGTPPNVANGGNAGNRSGTPTQPGLHRTGSQSGPQQPPQGGFGPDGNHDGGPDGGPGGPGGPDDGFGGPDGQRPTNTGSTTPGLHLVQ